LIGTIIGLSHRGVEPSVFDLPYSQMRLLIVSVHLRVPMSVNKYSLQTKWRPRFSEIIQLPTSIHLSRRNFANRNFLPRHRRAVKIKANNLVGAGFILIASTARIQSSVTLCGVYPSGSPSLRC